MEKQIEEFYQKFGREILLEKESDKEEVIKEAEEWWKENYPLLKDYSRPRLKFKCKK